MNSVECNEVTELVSVDPDRMGGVACFKGTRVPVEFLFQHLADGISLDEFLESYDSVTRDQAEQLLKWSLQAACREAGALEMFA